MMQGMNEPSKDYWKITADSKEEAINKVLNNQGYNNDKDSSFFKGCLSVTKIKEI